MILDDMCPVDNRGPTQAGGRGANWEAGVQVCSHYGLDQRCGEEKADRRNGRV